MSVIVAAFVLSQVPAVPYRWKSVQMVGAGFVDGVVFHPTAKDARFARTDMGGAYRWDKVSKQWAPMLDWVPYADLNWMGVESIAVDPRDSRRVYLACGTYTSPDVPDGAILRSNDGGKTFAATRVPIKFGGNENGRGNGERLSVDPANGNHLLLGTRQKGLWQSVDGAKTWKRVEGFTWQPVENRPVGVVATLFYPDSETVQSRTRRAFAAVSDRQGPTLYETTDGGTNWSPVPGGPIGLVPTHLVRGKDAQLWLTFGSSAGPSGMTNGAVYRFDPKNRVWTDVTPDKPTDLRRFGYAAVSVQADDPNTAIVSSFNRPGSEQIFRTRDAGKTWKEIIGGKETYRYDKAPYVAKTGIHWLFDIEIDPKDSNHALFTTGYGGHETFNLTDADRGKPVIWHVLAKGIEESVALSLVSPTKGPDLISGIGDYGGFVHWDLDHPSPTGSFQNPSAANTESVAVAILKPEIVVRVGHAWSSEPPIGYSLDFGKSWQPAPTIPPGARDGSIAVSADGKTWIWSVRQGSFQTDDLGKTWTAVEGLPPGLRAVSDPIDSNRFYALDLFGGGLFESTNAGQRFGRRQLMLDGGLPVRGGDRGDSRGGQDRLYALPGQSGDLWIAAFDGLYRGGVGRRFEKLSGVETLHAFGFGAPASGQIDPALYLAGTVRGLRGIFRSTDIGKTWTRINDDAHQWGLVLQITGDPKKFGRVYVGTHGRGTFYGDPR